MDKIDLNKKIVVDDAEFNDSGRKDVYGGLNPAGKNQVDEIVKQRDLYINGIDDCEKRLDKKLKQYNVESNKRNKLDY